MAREMKIWSCNLDGRTEGVVAALTKTRAAELMGVSLNHLNNYGGETWSEFKVRMALGSPEVAFGGPMEARSASDYLPLGAYREKLRADAKAHYDAVINTAKRK